MEKRKEYLKIYQELAGRNQKGNARWVFFFFFLNGFSIRSAFSKTGNFHRQKGVKGAYLPVGAGYELDFIQKIEFYNEDYLQYPRSYFKIPVIENNPEQKKGDKNTEKLADYYANCNELEQIKMQWHIIGYFFKEIALGTAVELTYSILEKGATVSNEFKNILYEYYKIKERKEPYTETSS